ncbi:telomerase reverse transcriptase-like [Galleria mellonella]|uniref:Telomerase reverse transcriptase n=1 Tax=Galleria mellonella TaxID=7137 RepID=A0ABM3MN79_GALME|nr:telomerase reverse transcriptase-like [Galleria mellonella]
MEGPICFSQYFVDKQNVRSFSNIIKSKLLKNEDMASFLLHLFEDDDVVKELSTNFLTMLTVLRLNLRNKSKQDFKHYFICEENITEVLHPVSKEDIYINCMKALKDIIPRIFYANCNNIKIFEKLTQTIIYNMKRQHINLEKHITKWDFTVGCWKSISEIVAKKVLRFLLMWIFQYVLSGMISLNFYVTTSKIDADENKLFFFRKREWQSFYDKKIANMILSKIIKRSESYCSGKMCKRSYSFTEKVRMKIIRKDIPKLHLVLKPNNNCRPIVRYKNNTLTTSEKYKMKDRLQFLKTLIGKYSKKTEIPFYNIYQKWVNLNKPKLYFVKADLSNAFGSINRQELVKILDERFSTLISNEKCLRSKEKIKQQYKDLIVELSKPILVRAGSTVFEWKAGLVQGYKYSPALSELYYTHKDELYFNEHLQKSKTEIHLFTRVVDDYLYITDSLIDAQSFLEALSKYKNINYEKTIVNFNHPTIKFSDEITFLGYTYDTKTIQVRRASNIYFGQICYKISFSQAIMNISKFLEQRIGQSSIQINSHIFNLHYNSEKAVWRHIFTTLCLSANKFCTILAILCEADEMKNYLVVYKKRITVRLCNAMIDMLLRNKPADIPFIYCINHFRYLSWKALNLCAQKTSKCNGLVPLINDEMAKANCIFGKWKDHACRIGSNGANLRPAVKEVCRRTDLRIIVKGFVTLPDGLQCYNRRKMMCGS